jgi:methionyl-tRNA synthetase
MNKNFFITTTLPYVNAPLHMGHALEFVRTDTIARYKKLLGYDVYFNTGTDEHGIKIYDKAKESGVSANDFVDQGFITFKEQIKMFGTDESILHFIRTTDNKHEKIAQDFWRVVDQNGYIYKKSYQAKYCVGCESEKTDSELVEGVCPLHPGKELKIISEENYFFKYSLFGDKLLELYEKNSNFVIPDFRLNEIRNFVKNGLQDFSISRLKEKMPWGIEVPGDKSQVMYVWFDALTNYISTLTDDGIETLDELLKSEKFIKYWVNGNPTQYCGKDNIRFQSAMWQAMLMSANVPNSHQIIINGFITGEGGIRMSKTLGNVVDPRDVVAEYGIDALRYFLLREVGSFEDSPFTLERFQDAYNSGLANGLGNLTSRILTLSEKYLEEKVILPEYDYFDIKENMEKFDIKLVMDLTWNFIRDLDEYIQKEEPFKVIKVDENAGREHIKLLVQKLFIIAKRLIPMMPETAEKILHYININKKPETPLFLRK